MGTLKKKKISGVVNVASYLAATCAQMYPKLIKLYRDSSNSSDSLV